MHIGVTLFGSRRLHLNLADSAPVFMHTGPGHVYFGNLCCAEHWVEHFEPDPEPLLPLEGLGPVEVVLLFRCAVFRQSMGQTMATGPTPHVVHHAALSALQKVLVGSTWSLPTLADCLAVGCSR